MPLAPYLPFIYRVLKPAFPGCLWDGDPTQPTIALTFDDGPHPDYTLPLLEVLEQYQIPASFFWLGVCVRRAPALAKHIYQSRHWVGLHGYDHRSFPTLSSTELKQTLQHTQEAIADACNLPLDFVQQTIRDVRPPNGLFTPQTLADLHQWNYRPVMWSVVPEDWVLPGVSIAVQRVLTQTQNGSLIVLHDGHCGGQDVAATAAEMIPALLDRGYQFVTVEQLWQQRAKLRIKQSPKLSKSLF